jgi:hypothetical protein
MNRTLMPAFPIPVLIAISWSIVAYPVTVTLALPPVNWRSLMAGGRPP